MGVGGLSNCLFPIETHITCDSQGIGGVYPLSSSGSEHVLLPAENLCKQFGSFICGRKRHFYI